MARGNRCGKVRGLLTSSPVDWSCLTCLLDIGSLDPYRASRERGQQLGGLLAPLVAPLLAPTLSLSMAYGDADARRQSRSARALVRDAWLGVGAAIWAAPWAEATPEREGRATLSFSVALDPAPAGAASTPSGGRSPFAVSLLINLEPRRVRRAVL